MMNDIKRAVAYAELK